MEDKCCDDSCHGSESELDEIAIREEDSQLLLAQISSSSIDLSPTSAAQTNTPVKESANTISKLTDETI